MSQNVYTAIKNFIIHNTYDRVTQILESGGTVTDAEIDELQNALYAQIVHMPEVKMSKNGVRSVIVTYITSEFGSSVMGLTPTIAETKQVDPDAWKKWRRKINAIRKGGAK